MMPSNGTILNTSSPSPEPDVLQTHKQGEEEPREQKNKEEKHDVGGAIKKVGRPGRKRKTEMVESVNASKDVTSVPKCHMSSTTSHAGLGHNGEVESVNVQLKPETPTPERGSPEQSPLERKKCEYEQEDLLEGDTVLENGRCTLSDGLDPQEVDDDVLMLSAPKKRGRRSFSDNTEKNKEEKEEEDEESDESPKSECPSTPQEWQTVASQFAARWDFPNCGGAIDGKHVRIVPPPHSGSYYWNYKGFHSIVLMAVVSAHYEFLYVDVGKNGRMSDGGVFNHTEFGHRLQTGGLELPPDEDNVEGLPFVFIADEAFGLGDHLMRPFPQRSLTPERRIFNYRLARARRVVENAFGIMANRFRLLLTSLHLAEYKLNTIILACCVMHNYLRKHSGTYSLPIGPEAGVEGNMTGLDNRPLGSAPQSAQQVRDLYLQYFNGRGAIEMAADP